MKKSNELKLKQNRYLNLFYPLFLHHFVLIYQDIFLSSYIVLYPILIPT